MSYTTEHTPGPWRQGTTAEGHTEVYGPDVGGGPGQEITVAQAWGNRPGEAAANARLIAAAPDLYEALRWLVHLHHGVSRGGGKPSDAEWQEAIEAGKAALVKAEGREVGEKPGQ